MGLLGARHATLGTRISEICADPISTGGGNGCDPAAIVFWISAEHRPLYLRPETGTSKRNITINLDSQDGMAAMHRPEHHAFSYLDR